MKTLKFILTSALVMFFGTVMAQDITAKYNEAAALIGQQKYAEAIPALEEVMKNAAKATDDQLELVAFSKKTLPDLYYRAGRNFATQQNFDEAIVYFSKGYDLAELYGDEPSQLRIAPMLSRVYQAKGGAAFNAKDYNKAIEVFSQAYDKFPTETELALLLAKSYAESGNFEKAVEIYQNVIELEGKHSRYVQPAATAKSELTTYMLVEASDAGSKEDMDRLVRATDIIFRHDPRNPKAHLMRVQIANNLKKYDAVIEYGDAAAEAQEEPENKSNVYFFIGSAHENKGNKPRAVEYYRKVTQGPNAARARQQASSLSN